MLNFFRVGVSSVILRSGIAAFVALVIGFTSVMPAYAAGGQTGNLQGTIVDATSKAPLANVTVRAVAPSGTFTAHTDARGFFAINGMTVDTYSVSFSASGYDVFTESGVTLQGDQTTNLGSLSVSKTLQHIGGVSRSRSSVFQSGQTTDEVTVSGNRIQEALGNPTSTDETALALSVPGVQLTNIGALTIRGGLSTEVGYQLDGIPVDEPFLNGNSTLGHFNGIGSLQIVAGAGDPSQGNIGGGVVNEIEKRGSYNQGGSLAFNVGGPSFDHLLNFQYGMGTKDGRFSDFISYVSSDNVPYIGSLSQNAIDVGQADALSRIHNADFLNNFVFKFGKDQNQSLQILYEARDTEDFGDRSGLQGRVGYPYNPFTQCSDALPPTSQNAGYAATKIPVGAYCNVLPAPGSPLGYGLLVNGAPPYAGFTYVGGPYSPGITPENQNVFPTSPEEVGWNPFNFLKFEYDVNFDSSTALQFKTFNEQTSNGSTDYYNYGSAGIYQNTGGTHSGLIADLEKTFSSKNTVSVGGDYNDVKPSWQGYEPYVGFLELQPLGIASGPQAAGLGDFAPGGYLSTQGVNNVAVPAFGINYNKTLYQEFGFYLREQFTPSQKLKFDLAIREDGFNWQQGPNPYNNNPLDLGNPNDVPNGGTPADGVPSLGDYLRNEVVHPRIPEPRFSAVYNFDRNDSLRFSFARSIEFPTGQTLGTPMGLQGVDPRLLNVAATGNTTDPSTWTCGSGYNPKNLVAGNANADPVHGGGYFRCANYAQELYWAFDQNFDAPDVGNNFPQTDNNTELTYQHQFKNGWGTRLTTYYKRDFNVPALNIISQVVTDGVIQSQVFGVTNVSLNKTSGVEFGLNTPDRAVGFSGYLSATYTNVIDSVPPLVGSESSVPLVSLASIALQNTYRAGYVSPFVVNLGVNYKTKNGFRINPQLTYDRGFPAGAGNLLATQLPDGTYANIPNTNLNPSQYSGFEGITGSGNAPNYVDPVNPGTLKNPYIAATRGTAETSSAGGVLTRPRVFANLDLEKTFGRHTVGLLIANVFGNQYNEPVLNPYYQPVATGVSGPQSGTTALATQGTASYLYGGYRNIPSYIYGNGAYVEGLNAPTSYQLYYSVKI